MQDKDVYEKLEQNKCKCEKIANNAVDVLDVVDTPLAVAEEAPKRRGRKPKENASPSASSTTSSISSESDEMPKRRGRKSKVVVE